MQPGGRLHLLSLPLELQDMIFKFAYDRPVETTFIDSRSWRSRQKMERRQSRPTLSYLQSYPGSKVASFLVSKQYFVAAAQAYVSSAPISLEQTLGHRFELLQRGILAAFVQELTGLYEFSLHGHLPSVKVLQVMVGTSRFEAEDEEERGEDELPVMQQQLAEADFPKSLVCMLDKFKGLKKIKLTPRRFSDLEPAEEAHWQANIKILEGIVKRRVLVSPTSSEFFCEKATKNRILGLTPLYAGSNVYFEDHSVVLAAKLRENRDLTRAEAALAGSPWLEANKAEDWRALELKELGKSGGIQSGVQASSDSSPRLDGRVVPPQKRSVSQEETKHIGVWMSDKEFETICAGLKAAGETPGQTKKEVANAMELCKMLKKGECVQRKDTDATAVNGKTESTMKELKPEQKSIMDAEPRTLNGAVFSSKPTGQGTYSPLDDAMHHVDP